MSLFLRTAILFALAVGVASADEPVKPEPKFKLGRDTTFVDGPLDKDGYIDYEAALNERLKGKITPETNAVVLLLKCLGPKPAGKELHADFYKMLGIDPPPMQGAYLVSHDLHFKSELGGENTKAFEDLETRLKRRPWKADDSPKHAAWLKLNAEVLDIAVAASKCSDYFHPMISRKPDGSKGILLESLLPIPQKCRELGALLSLRSTLSIGAGKNDDAFADVLAIHRLGRLVARGGTLIELLVGIALQSTAHSGELAILERGRLTAKPALSYQAALHNLKPMATVAEKLESSERFTFLDAIQSSRRNGFDILSGPDEKSKTEKEVEVAAAAFDWNSILTFGNKWYDKCRAAMLKPTRAERIVAGELIVKSLRKMVADIKNMSALEKSLLRTGDASEVRAKLSEKVGMTYVGMLIPAFQLVSDAADRAEQIHRNGLLAAGLAAHFADHKKYPDTLADLVPKYIAEVPGDVFSEKAMIYKPTAAGYLLYSVGVNGIDDGGQLISEEPRGDDLGVRMPRK